MLKFFRKYNMIILVVGGCLLMVTFLIGSSLQRLQGLMNNRTIATMRGEKISAKDYSSAQTEFAAVKTVLEPAFPVFIKALEGQSGNSGVDAWLMLSREAGRLGLVGGVQDGREMLSLTSEIAAQQYLSNKYRMNMTPQLLELDEVRPEYEQALTTFQQILEQQRQSFVRQGKSSERGVDLALAKAHGVLRLFSSYRNEAALVSTPELRQQAERVLDVAVIEMVTINAAIVGDELPDPSEQELREQYESYRSARAGSDGLGFGYLRPPAVQLEWIAIEARPIEDALTLDPVEVRVHYKNHKSERGWSDDFAAEKPKVEADLRADTAERVIEAGVEAGRNEMRRMLSGLPDDGAFKSVPADWAGKLATTESIAEKIRAAMTRQAGIDVSQAVSVQSTNDEWKTGRDLGLLPGIGRSSLPGAGTRSWMAFTQLAMLARGITPADQAQLQVGLINGPLVTGMDRFFFRLTDARPESPPDSIDEVREKVASDFELKRGWDLLTNSLMPEIEKAATADGLNAVAKQYGMSIQTPIEVSRLSMTPKMKTPQPIRGENQESLRNAIMDRVAGWDPMTPVDSIDPAQRIIVMPVEQAKGLVVAKIIGRYPVTKERLYSSYSMVENSVIQTFTPELSDNIYSIDRLKERFDFKLVKPSKEDDEIEGESLDSPPATVDPNAIPPG